MCLYITQSRAVRHDVGRLTIVHGEVTKCVTSTVRSLELIHQRDLNPVYLRNNNPVYPQISHVRTVHIVSIPKEVFQSYKTGFGALV
jgi:hypothetical protein